MGPWEQRRRCRRRRRRRMETDPGEASRWCLQPGGAGLTAALWRTCGATTVGRDPGVEWRPGLNNRINNRITVWNIWISTPNYLFYLIWPLSIFVDGSFHWSSVTSPAHLSSSLIGALTNVILGFLVEFIALILITEQSFPLMNSMKYLKSCFNLFISRRCWMYFSLISVDLRNRSYL